jgi:hypothetical protein
MPADNNAICKCVTRATPFVQGGGTGALFMAAMGAGGFLGRTTGRSHPHVPLKSRPPPPLQLCTGVPGDERITNRESAKCRLLYFGYAPDTVQDLWTSVKRSNFLRLSLMVWNYWLRTVNHWIFSLFDWLINSNWMGKNWLFLKITLSFSSEGSTLIIFNQFLMLFVFVFQEC